MPINKKIQLESKQCEIVFPGDQCVVAVDKFTYQQMKIGDIICKQGQECQTQMEFYIALCCVESTVISRGYKAMIHVGGIITEFEVLDVIGVLNDAGTLNPEINIFGSGERAILKIRVLGRNNPICVSTFERDEFLGRVLIRHQRTTVGAGVVIEEWNNKILNTSKLENVPKYLLKIQNNRYESIMYKQIDNKFMNQEKGKKQSNKITEISTMDPFKIWQMKKYIQAIQDMPSQDCVVTLYIRASESPESITKILNTKRTETVNIKSSSTKAAIQSALDKASQFVTTYVKSVPRNGLCIFAGSTLIAFEPIQPIVYTGSSLFCEKDFNINPVEQILQPKQKYIFILFDGYTARIYSVCGSSIVTLSEIEADIPKKGQLEETYTVYNMKQIEKTRTELREQYVMDIQKMVNDTIIDPTGITSIFLAYTSDFKDLVNDKMFSPMISKLVNKQTVTIGYVGSSHGLNSAIWQVKNQLINVSLINEIEICSQFIEIVYENKIKPEEYPKLYCNSLKNVVQCIGQGIVDCVLIQDEYQCDYIVTDDVSGYILPLSNVIVDENGFEYQLNQNTKILQRQHIFDHFNEIGVVFSFIGCKTAEGNQFCKGFDGIGAILTRPNLQNDE
ncbi:Eukaryotic_peptide chain release factor subunit 1 [Hexamita inflata]|uniref:Eukaryotic peptide chain release factor subunit 1 n=1 Tax=Hexamita inflata TaxID=28002 RepID=A0AA86V0K7_9EUKA|nr:Eukaryotic peptide chain release factor subunit 1 [Hexamita inflata]